MSSLICTACIERLRVAYDFRNSCLQSDQTLQRYMNQLQEEVKQTSASVPLMTPTKFEFGMSSGSQDSISNVTEDTQGGEYLPLKQFLEQGEVITKSENFLNAAASRNSEIAKTDNFLTVSVSRATSPPTATGKVNNYLMFLGKND